MELYMPETMQRSYTKKKKRILNMQVQKVHLNRLCSPIYTITPVSLQF